MYKAMACPWALVIFEETETEKRVDLQKRLKFSDWALSSGVQLQRLVPRQVRLPRQRQ